jgi:hypothetical protein
MRASQRTRQAPRRFEPDDRIPAETFCAVSADELAVRFRLDDDAAPFLSRDAEVDHVLEFQHGGQTEVDNLVPLKQRLHRLESVTRIRLDPKPGGGIRIRTRTGYDSDPPPFQQAPGCEADASGEHRHRARPDAERDGTFVCRAKTACPEVDRHRPRSAQRQCRHELVEVAVVHAMCGAVDAVDGHTRGPQRRHGVVGHVVAADGPDHDRSGGHRPGAARR